MTLKGIKCRLYPNEEQQIKINANFGYNRFVWNQMLAMMIERYENNPQATFLNAFALNNLLPVLKMEYPWLKEAESTSLQVTNHNLVEAYKKFFRERHGFPKFKSKKYPKQSYQSKCMSENIKEISEHAIKLPKIGIMPFKSGRQINGKIKAATIRLSATGKYYATLTVDCEIQPLSKTTRQVGIDLGVSDLAICSDGTRIPTIRFDKIMAHKRHYWEKRLARRRLQANKEIAWDHHNKALNPRGLDDFKNYHKAKRMVAKINEKISNQRTDYVHKMTTQLVQENDVIVMEDLKAKNLLKNHKLSRAIANQSWREIRRQLDYKCAWYGKELIMVNPYKTSQVCSECGYDDGYHALAIREWDCPSCGTHHDRDINAAKNILSKAMA